MEKRKNRPQRIFITGMGCLLALGMFALGGILGVVAGVVALPDLLGYPATQQSLSTRSAWLDETAIALAGFDLALANTRTANNARATQNALDTLATLASLTNEQNLLNQTATYSAQAILATQTSQAVANLRQATQVALDYQATQAQLQQNATQVELDFQRTQAALGYHNQTDALADPSEPTRTPSLTPTPSPTPTTATPTLHVTRTALPTPLPRIWIDEAFEQGIPDAWRTSDDAHWHTTDGALRATISDAWLLSASSYPAPYRLYMGITPTLADTSRYAVLLATNISRYAIVYDAIGLQVQTVSLYEWQPDTQEPFGQLLTRQTVEGLLIGNTAFVVTLRGAELRAELNGTVLLRHDLGMLNPTSVGILLPQGAQLNQLTLTRLD